MYQGPLAQATYSNRQIITSSQLRDLTDVPEARTHNNSVVPVLLVVVVNSLDALDTGIVFLSVLFLGIGFVPVKDATNEGRNQECAGLGTGNGLDLGEQQRQIAVNLVLRLEDVGSFDAFVCRRNLDEDAGLVNTLFLVKL